MNLLEILSNRDRPDGNALDMILSALQGSNASQPVAITERDLAAVQGFYDPSFLERVPMSPATSAGINTIIEAPEPAPSDTSAGMLPQPTGNLSEAERAFIAAADEVDRARVANFLASQLTAPPNQSFDPNAAFETFKAAKTGEERVNAFSGEHGVRAIRDPKTGSVTLTNIGEDGKPTAQSQKQIYGWNPTGFQKVDEASLFNPMDANTSKNIDSLLDQLAKAKTSDEAEGIARTTTTALAEEFTKLEQQAYSFAEKELGIPELRNQLEAMQQRDRAVGATNGIPFISPEYNQTLNLLAQRQRELSTRVNDQLSRNITYQRLKAAEINTKTLVTQKINKLGQQESSILLKQTQQEIRDEARREAAVDAVTAMPEHVREMLYRLNPAIKGEGKEEALVKFYQSQAKDKNFVALAEAPIAARPMLALQGNPYAIKLVAEQEAAVTGKAVADVEKDLLDLTRTEPSDKMVNDWIDSQVANLSSDQQKERRMALKQMINNARMSTATDKGRAEWLQYKSAIVAQDLRTAKTSRYLSDIGNWGLQDPEIEAAAAKARKLTGKASVDAIAVALMDGKEGRESLEAIARYKELLRARLAKEKNSTLGTVDEAAVLNAVNRAVINTGSLSNWIRNTVGLPTSATAMPINDLLTTPATPFTWAASKFGIGDGR